MFIFKMKNHMLNQFIGFLIEIELTGKENRRRMKQVRKFTQYMQNEYHQDREEILNELVEKDEQGNFKTTNNMYVSADMPRLSKELRELDEEYYKEELTAINIEEFEFLYKIVANYDKPLSNEKAMMHDNFCEMLEIAIEPYREEFPHEITIGGDN